MNSSVCLRRIVSLLTLLACVLAHCDCVGQELLLTEMPAQVRAVGTVCDEQGVPVLDADVQLIVTGRRTWELYCLGKPANRATRTNATGEFSLDFAVDDPMLRSFAQQNSQFLLVQAAGYNVQIVDVQLSNLMIDLPIKITIRKCSDLVLHVQDSTGAPIQNAKVTPAKVAGKQLFHRMPWLLEHTTDTQGRVRLVGFDPIKLESVYVETATLGNHLIPITVEKEVSVAKIGKTGRVTGRLNLTDGTDVQKLQGTRLLVLTVSAEFGTPSRFSWAETRVDEKGNFAVDSMGPGETLIRLDETFEYGYAAPYQEFPSLKADEFGNLAAAVTLNIGPIQSQEITFVDEAGQPLSGIHVGDANVFFGFEPQLSSSEGKYTHRWPQGQVIGGQLFPQDAFERYQVTDPFGVLLDRIERVAGQPLQVQMTRSQSLLGIVTDAQGNRVAGAKISYAYASERFRLEQNAISDNSGKFEIRGLPPSSAVEIRASHGELATDARQIVSIPAGSPTEIHLVLLPQVVASPVGRIVDQTGTPVAGVKITLRKGVPMIEEGFGLEELTPHEVSPDFPDAISDNDGRFQFPPMVEFSERLKLTLQKGGFLTRETPFYDGSARAIENQQIDLGDIMIAAESPLIRCKIRVIDGANEQPVANSEVVFVGILSGRGLGVTDADGGLEIDLMNTPQIVTVLSPDRRVHFQFLEQIEEHLTIRLDAKQLGMDRRPHPWFQRDSEKYLAASQRLLDQLAVPPPKDSTFVRQFLYFTALAGIDAAQMQRILTDPAAKYEYRDDFTSFSIQPMLQQSPATIIEWCRQESTDIGRKLLVLGLAAQAETRDDLKDEFYGEAVILLNEMSGQSRLLNAGRISQILLLDGEVEAAEAVLSDAWKTADELKQILASGEEKQLTIESRFFLPMYAILSLDEALQLIRLTASQSEMDRLLTEALLMHSLAKDLPLNQLLSEHKVPFSTHDKRFLMSKMGNVPRMANWVAANLDALPTSGLKIQLLFLVARHLPPGEERVRLLREAAEVRGGCSLTYYYDDPARYAFREIVQFRSLVEGELDEFIFACLKHAPDSFNNRRVDVFGTLVKLLALHDQNLAKQLLQSALDAEVWHGGVEHSSRFRNNHLLRSAAWVDPDFACEVAEALSQRWDGEGATYKLQLYSDMIQALNEARLGIE
ncbi:MAG: carboxypeptidase-like regulatory domain-containing protein [Pirellulaceae bacterium]|nr:carboxypeptidase-like regulatory domain-containing protein [Pirellulaceae bacterium]